MESICLKTNNAEAITWPGSCNQTDENHVTVNNVDHVDRPIFDVESKSRPKAKSRSQSQVKNSFKMNKSRPSQEREHPQRQNWTNKLDFIMSCTGFAVGLGNVWRFPYLCYKNGGGAFFIPYMISVCCGGVPVFFMEVALGQYMNQGGISAWKICPIFQGVGVAAFVLCCFMNIYYIVVLAWDLYYWVMSFTTVLPWSHCNNTWNTNRCKSVFSTSKWSNVTHPCVGEFISNNTNCTSAVTVHNNLKNNTPVDAVVEFWERKVLQISDGVDHPDGIVWELLLCLLAVWIVCYLCVWKGIKWTGKIVYFTATFPYVILTLLLLNGCTLEGSLDGIIYYLKPDFSRLSDAQVWIDAGTQVFYSYALAMGAMTGLGSYNKFHNNCYRDCITIACINTFTSVYAGCVIFTVLGFMANEQGVNIDDVAESGPGLAFIAYPKAVSLMPLSPLWAVLFFFMIFLVGLDSQFVGVEAVITAAVDLVPQLRKYNRKIYFIAIYVLLNFLIELTMITRGGMYVFQLFDYYAASGLAMLWICFFECITISWIYGTSRFYDNLEMMIGYRINPWLRICWSILTPVVTAGIFIFMLVQFRPLTYNKTYEYPAFAQAFGICLALASMLWVPIYLLIKLLTTPGPFKERWRILTTPLLPPSRIPAHWPDSQRLTAIGHRAQHLNNRTVLCSCSVMRDILQDEPIEII